MRFVLAAFVLAAFAVPVSGQPLLPAPDAQKQRDDGTPAAARSGNDALNATLLAQLDTRSSYGDLWGWVDPATGREYALLTARFQGLSVIDLDTPTPTEVGFVPTLVTDDGYDGDAKDVKTYGRYAYLAHEYENVLVIDLADPTDPTGVGEIEMQPSDTYGGSHNILVVGDYLYVVGGRSPGGLRIYDLAASPIAPPLIGSYAGPFGSDYYHDLDVVGDIAYAAAIYNKGIDVIDLSDRTDPELITTIIYPATYMGAHNVCVAPNSETIFVGDEIGSGTWTRAFDVSDLSDPELLSNLIVEEQAAVHNCYVKGSWLYVAHYTEGLQVFDVSAPASPERIAFYDTYPNAGFGYKGAWTAYPYLPSGRVIISDLQGGLFVVQVTAEGVGVTARATSPLTVAPGGAVSFDYTIANTRRVAATGDLFFTAERGGVVVAQGVVAGGTLQPGQSLNGSYTQQVPAIAPAGVYTYTLKIGRFPSPEIDAATFTVIIEGSSVADAPATWAITNATPWAPTEVPAPTARSTAVPAAALTAFPNPFAETTTLRFGLVEGTEVRLAVYDVLGREVAVLVDGGLEAGIHEAPFNAQGLPSGVYAYRLDVAGTVQTGHLTLLR